MGLIQDARVEQTSKNKFSISRNSFNLSIYVNLEDLDNFIHWVETGESRENIHKYIDILSENGLVEISQLSSDLPQEYIERHSRTLRYLAMYENNDLPAIDMLGNLYNSTVVVVGNGGTGSWVVSNLLQAGIGHVIGIDPDIVDITNLNRSAIFTPEDVGKLKVEVISDYCKKMFPHQQYSGVEKFISCSNDLIDISRGSDFMVSAADQPLGKIREWLRQSAEKLDIPLLETFGGGIGPIRASYAYEYAPHSVQGADQNYIPCDISRRKRGPSVPFFHPLADSIGITQAIFEELSGSKQSILRFNRIQKSRDVNIGNLVEASN